MEVYYGFKGDSLTPTVHVVKDSTIYGGNDIAYHLSTNVAAGLRDVAGGLAAVRPAVGSQAEIKGTWTRLDTIEDIADYGTNLGKDGQLFLTEPQVLEGLDLTNPADVARAEQILGLPSGRLTNSSTIVRTDIDVSGLNVRLPSEGNELFIPGGYTSGGAREIVVDPLNIFSDSSVQSIRFFHGGN